MKVFREHYEPKYPGSNVYDDYVKYNKFSVFKNLFFPNVHVTICPSKTISDLNVESYSFKNNILNINQDIDEQLTKLFDFYGWQKIDNSSLEAKYEIVDPFIKIATGKIQRLQRWA